MRSTYWAFYSLVMTVRPKIICDIGSCDGSEAIGFKRLRRDAYVIAFEANKGNYDRIAEKNRISGCGIDVRHAAVTDKSGPVTFNEVEVPPDRPWAAGVSSLRRRSPSMAYGLKERPVTVQGVRLDDVLECIPGDRIGLWIDVEGAAEQVIAGLGQAVDRVAFLHIETENSEMWVGQATTKKVVHDLHELGFEQIASVQEVNGQQNIVMVSRRLNKFSTHVAIAKSVARSYPVLQHLSPAFALAVRVRSSARSRTGESTQGLQDVGQPSQ